MTIDQKLLYIKSISDASHIIERATAQLLNSRFYREVPTNVISPSMQRLDRIRMYLDRAKLDVVHAPLEVNR